MKNSQEYAKRINKLVRSLKQKYDKIQQPEYDDPVRSLVYAVVSEHMSASETKTIINKLKKHFVDFNDLRVSRPEEIRDIFGNETTPSHKTGLMLTEILNQVYNEYDMVSLASLVKMGKRPARKELEKLESASRFVVNYCVLTALGAHTIPLTKKMIEYLRAG